MVRAGSRGRKGDDEDGDVGGVFVCSGRGWVDVSGAQSTEVVFEAL